MPVGGSKHWGVARDIVNSGGTEWVANRHGAAKRFSLKEARAEADKLNREDYPVSPLVQSAVDLNRKASHVPK